MEIITCTPDVYPAFLDALNEAFGHPAASAWFQQNVTHCTPAARPVRGTNDEGTPPVGVATEEEIGRHWICYLDGKLAGGLGAYPMEWAFETGTLQAFGVGQVFCAQAFRGRGVMSALMQAMHAEKMRQGVSVGFLCGDRHRYGHFGYDFGGQRVNYALHRRFVSHCATASATVTPAVPADIPRLEAAYSQLPSRVLRSPARWQTHLSRGNLVWLAAEADGGFAYLAHKKDAPNRICEVAGHPQTALALLQHVMEANRLDSLSLSLPVGRKTPLMQAVHGLASSMSHHPLGLVAPLAGRPVRSANDEAPLVGQKVPENLWMSEVDSI